MLEAAVGVMRHCARRSDTIIRYGGDEFLLLLPHIEEATFQQKLQDICCQISETRLPGLEDIRLSVSIGGLINRGEPIDCAVERANQLMMQAKKEPQCRCYRIPKSPRKILRRARIPARA